MKMIIILLIALMLVTTVSGCTAPAGQITSDQQATQTIRDVSDDISDVEDSISDIEQSLG